MSGEIASQILDRELRDRPGLRSITADHRSEFQFRALEEWAYRRGVPRDFIRPGKPVENVVIESFNGRFRDECLNANVFARYKMPDRRLKCGESITMNIGRMAH